MFSASLCHVSFPPSLCETMEWRWNGSPVMSLTVYCPNAHMLKCLTVSASTAGLLPVERLSQVQYTCNEHHHLSNPRKCLCSRITVLTSLVCPRCLVGWNAPQADRQLVDDESVRVRDDVLCVYVCTQPFDKDAASARLCSCNRPEQEPKSR